MDELSELRGRYADEIDVGADTLTDLSNAELSAPLLDTSTSFIPSNELKLSQTRLQMRVERLFKELAASLKTLGRIVDEMGGLEFTFTKQLKYHTKDELNTLLKSMIANYRRDLEFKHVLVKALVRKSTARELERDDYFACIGCWSACPYLDDEEISRIEKVLKIELG